MEELRLRYVAGAEVDGLRHAACRDDPHQAVEVGVVRQLVEEGKALVFSTRRNEVEQEEGEKERGEKEKSC